jgi:pimeloyl-ACP methyl ester carboxylesterase
MKSNRWAWLLLLLALPLMALACGDEVERHATATPTPTAERTDAEVILPEQPAGGFELTDPSFRALPGAQALFGELGGTVYRIEMPDRWNGRLALWAHGFRGFDSDLVVDMPPMREHLIENGYAWAASSYSANGFAPFEGAHETAALHDYFVQEFGDPEYVYIAGGSMGGNATLLSLELFPSRYDGALAACSAMGLAELDFIGHYVVLGAYAAGVTQEEFDAAESIAGLIDERILPTLNADPEARDLFEGLVATLSGGPRPFRHEGFEEYYVSNFELASAFAPMLIPAFDNTDFVYPAVPASGISSDELNKQVVRIAGSALVRKLIPSLSELTGAVPVPLLMIHTTGDGWVPISGMQDFRHLAEAAGNSDLLVQRAVRAPGHCDFSDQELISTMEDLVNWVENGVKPEGEDILGSLEDAGQGFTDPVREGDPGGL